MPHIEIGGRRLYYELRGEAGGEVLCFVNGLTQSTPLWAAYADHFVARGYRVLLYDMAGQGRSAKPIMPLAFEAQSALLRDLADALSLDRLHLAGISFGGVVALRFAIDYPDRTASLVAMSTFSEMPPQLLMLGSALYRGLAEVGIEYLQDLLLPMNTSSKWLGTHLDNLRAIKQPGYASNDVYALQNLMEGLHRFEPLTHRLPEITCPAMVLHGEWDFLTPREVHEILRQGLPNCRLVFIQHGYHAYTLECPEVTMRTLEVFWGEVCAGTFSGDGSVWAANEDPKADPPLIQVAGDHRRAIQLAEPDPMTSVGPAGDADHAA